MHVDAFGDLVTSQLIFAAAKTCNCHGRKHDPLHREAMEFTNASHKLQSEDAARVSRLVDSLCSPSLRLPSEQRRAQASTVPGGLLSPYRGAGFGMRRAGSLCDNLQVYRDTALKVGCLPRRAAVHLLSDLFTTLCRVASWLKGLVFNMCSSFFPPPRT